MPVYDYKCQTHGLFHDLATLEQSGEPMPCPTCRQPSARVVVITPSLARVSKAEKESIERNEKSANEPMTLEEYEAKPDNCQHSKQDRSKSNLIYTADGNKSFPSMRPWMISH